MTAVTVSTLAPCVWWLEDVPRYDPDGQHVGHYTRLRLDLPDGSMLVARPDTGVVLSSGGTGAWRHIVAVRAAGLVTATHCGPETYGHTTYRAVTA